MKFLYDAKKHPPVPYIEIRVGIPEESLKVGPLRGLVDSGADATIIPLRLLRQLKLEIYNHKFIRSHWGERRTINTYRVDIGIGEGMETIRLPGIEIVGDDQSSDILIGRNILNKARVLLDGPKQIIEISE